MRSDDPEEIARVNPITGEIVGFIDRHTAHTKGVWHACTHVWITDARGRLLFQQRAPWVRRFPNLWDISAAGHARSDEDGMREVTEELGVVPPENQLSFVGILSLEHDMPGFLNKERPRVFLWRSELALEEFSFPDGEVAALAAVELSQLEFFLAGAVMELPVLRDGKVEFEVINGQDRVPLPEPYWSALREVVKW